MLLDLFLLSSHILFSATLPVNFHPTTVLLFISSIFSMGGSISSSSSDERTQERSGTTSQGLGDLPESCITSILVHLDPLDICRLARLSRAFRGASFADIVWDPKLPLNYKFLVEKVLGEGLENLGKRDIYTRLCRPNQFDGGTKELWLDKVSGDMFLSISSRALKITRVDDRRYWSHISTEESRFGTVAYLRQIWWVEVVGETEFEFSPGNYSLYFRIQLGKTVKRFGRRVCNLDEVHGWDIKPVRFQLSTSDGQESTTERYLQSRGSWGCYHVGDFRVESSKAPVRVKFSMVQIDCTHTKGGLSVDSVIICTSEMKTRLKLDS